jgi:hypothetical protein
MLSQPLSFRVAPRIVAKDKRPLEMTSAPNMHAHHVVSIHLQPSELGGNLDALGYALGLRGCFYG